MQYIKEINKRFNFINIIIDSISLAIIIILLDYYNVISFLFNNYALLSKLIMILLICYAIKEFVNKKIWKVVIIETINYFDKLLFEILGIGLVLFLYYRNFDICYNDYLWICLGLILIVLFVRINKIEKLINQSFNKKTNVYSISELYNNKIKDEELILLEEKALTNFDDDLLNMNMFLESIEDSLVLCKPKENFVIALLGKWGGGKTSVINLLKERINKNKDVKLDVFDPWEYDNKLSLFKGFYNCVFTLLEKNYGYFNYKELLKKYEDLVFNLFEKKTGVLLKNIFNNDTDEDIETIKQSINDCINYSNKKLIIVIDDIDRLSKEQILLIFKTVKTLFNFDNIVYVLCYDESRIKKIFKNELKIDSDYLNKIVQNKIVMPVIESAEICKIGKSCIFNLLNSYNIKNYDGDRLKDNLNLIFKDFSDLREVIRFINTISISIKQCSKLRLDICDYIVLEYIKFKDLELYNTIYNNSNMFVSEDVNYNLDSEWISTDKFNEKARLFFNDLFKNKEYAKGILSKVFPYVDNYNRGYAIRHDGVVTEERKKSIIKKRCSNGRYFKNYFIIRPGFFTKLSDLVDIFIKNVNDGKDFKKEFNYLVGEVNPDDHNLLFELIEIKLGEINDREKLFNCIYDNINDYEDNDRFLGLTSKERAQILLSSIINDEHDMLKQKQYLDSICKKDLLLLDSVLYWLGTNKYGKGKENEVYLYGMEIMKQELMAKMNSNFNIFENEYKRHYSLLFGKYLDNKEKIGEYFNGLINKNTVFRIIGDSISTWIGNGVRYEYNESRLENLVSLEKVEKALEMVDYKINKDQEKILKIYKNQNEEEYSEEINFDNL